MGGWGDWEGEIEGGGEGKGRCSDSTFDREGRIGLDRVESFTYRKGCSQPRRGITETEVL